MPETEMPSRDAHADQLVVITSADKVLRIPLGSRLVHPPGDDLGQAPADPHKLPDYLSESLNLSNLNLSKK